MGEEGEGGGLWRVVQGVDPLTVGEVGVGGGKAASDPISFFLQFYWIELGGWEVRIVGDARNIVWQ